VIDLPFWKVQAAGNDFVAVRCDDLAGLNPTDLALTLCERRFGIGSDGLLVLSQGLGLGLRMFNPDGSEDFCGNGARCAAMLMRDWGWADREFAFQHRDRTVLARINAEDRVTVTVPAASYEANAIPLEPPKSWRPGDVLEIAGVEGTPISTGSTHFVVFSDSVINDDAFFQLSPTIETDRAFPERTSIMWTNILDEGSLALRIWERGAGETLGCGTGSCAAAIVYLDRTGFEGPIQVHNPGGTITVQRREDGLIEMSSIPQLVFAGKAVVAAEGLVSLGTR